MVMQRIANPPLASSILALDSNLLEVNYLENSKFTQDNEPTQLTLDILSCIGNPSIEAEKVLSRYDGIKLLTDERGVVIQIDIG